MNRFRSLPRRALAKLQARRLNPNIISHPLGSKQPRISSSIVPDLQPTDRDCAIAKRLLTAWRCASESTKSQSPSPTDFRRWAEIKRYQSRYFEILSSGDPVQLASYLCNMNRHDATIGTVQGNNEFKRIQQDAKYRQFIALLAKDRLVSLAEAVGAIHCENPEQGAWGASIHMDIDLLVSGIERAIGLSISPPATDGGLLKIQSAGGCFSERDASALYTAWSIKQILTDHDCASITEIGAGVGKTAYWCHRLGLTSYTIVDLPHINVLQGFYLLQALPEARIVLYGEPDLPATSPHIVIYPDFHIGQLTAPMTDLVLNQDSFPEIDRATVLNYLAWIRVVSRHYFYSINHESRPPDVAGHLHLNVPELVAEVGGYARISRSPYWLRRGYVAELYKIRV